MESSFRFSIRICLLNEKTFKRRSCISRMRHNLPIGHNSSFFFTIYFVTEIIYSSFFQLELFHFLSHHFEDVARIPHAVSHVASFSNQPGSRYQSLCHSVGSIPQSLSFENSKFKNSTQLSSPVSLEAEDSSADGSPEDDIQPR